VQSRRAADGHRGRGRPSDARRRPLAGAVPPRHVDSDRGVPHDRPRLGPTAVRDVRGRVGTDARRVPERGARPGGHGRTGARAGCGPRPGRGARRRQRRPGGAGGRRRAAGGRRARADRRRPGGGRLGPKVALRRVADPAGRGPTVGDQDAVPGRLATQVRGQRGDNRVRGRVHVQPVQGRGHRAAGERDRAARGRPFEDDRPERTSGAHMHVPQAAQGGQAAGRLVRGNGRHRRGHGGQAHELHAHLQRAQRRRQVRLGRGQLRIRRLRVPSCRRRRQRHGH